MKKIQKQYQRRIKVSQNNDIFTTFQKHSTANSSTNKVEKSQKSHSFHQNQHEHIQSLRSTLKSLMPVSLQITKHFSRNIGISSMQSQQKNTQNDQYKFKLDQLAKHLGQIASKCHFSPADITKNKHQESNYTKKDIKAQPLFQKSHTLSNYEPIKSELFYRYSNSTSIQLPKNKSQSLVEKQQNHRSFICKSPIKLQNQPKNTLSQQLYKSKQKSKSKFNDGDSNRKKSYSKKEVIINDSLGTTSANKNLTKLFETIDNHTMDMFKGRQRSLTQFKKYQKVFKQNIHRSKITNVLVADQIYTSSLDYSIKKTVQNNEGKFESLSVQSFRGGVEHIGVLNNKIYGCGRDYYIRSTDGNYFCKFDKIPLSFCQTEKSNNINISFANNELKLFDLEKRQFLSSILIENKYALFCKVTKENYVGLKNSLFALDWRKREHLVNVYKDLYKDNITWLSDPFSNAFWYHNEGQLTILNQDFKKKGAKNIPFHSVFVNHHWGRSGLNILSQQGQGGYKVHHYQQFKQREQLDSEYQSGDLTNVLIRDKQLIYCSKSGQLIIKSNKR